MSRKQSTTLFVIAIILVVFVINAGKNNMAWNQKIASGEYYFPDLQDKINNISTIKLRQSDKIFEIVKDNNKWVLRNKDNYPADTSKVKANLIAAANAIKIETKTQRENLFPKLHIEDAALPNAKSYLMEFYGEDGNMLADVIVGKRKPNLLKKGEYGVYLRKPKSLETWLVSGDLNVSDGIKNWISTRLFTLIPDNLKMLTIKSGDRTELKFGRDPEDVSQFKMIDFLSGIETRTSIGLRSVLRRFLRVEFRDMREAKDYNRPPDTEINILTNDNKEIRLELYNELDGTGAWVLVKNTDHPNQIKNLGYEFYLDQNYKEQFTINLEDVLKIE
tara:strand:+ start:866 stop:1864 length:999 start_codon:yes stop_codon:yes gene_type:complete